jgi:DNA-binding CsgD family transcriptional regulator
MKISTKEELVLILLAKDKSAKEIAGILGNSVFTIQVHIRTIKLKLGVGTCHGAVGKYLNQQHEQLVAT